MKPIFKSTFCAFAILMAAAFLAGCASRLKGMAQFDGKLENSENTGYLSLNFENQVGHDFDAYVKEVNTGKRYLLGLDKPVNQAFILGFKVYDSRVGDSLAAPYTIIPMPPGDYQIVHAYANEGSYGGSSNNTVFISSGKEVFSIKARELTYVGDFLARRRFFLHVFPIGAVAEKLETDTAVVDSVFKNIPHHYTRITLH